MLVYVDADADRTESLVVWVERLMQGDMRCKNDL